MITRFRAGIAACDMLECRRMFANVASFSLINADTDTVISGYSTITSATSINLATLPTRNLNIRANLSGSGTVKSVRWGYDSNSNIFVDNSSPYALAGGSGNNFSAWTPTVGTHHVSAITFTGSSATGTKGTQLSFPLMVMDLAPVSITATDAIASEPGTDTGTFQISRAGSTSAALTVNVKFTGSASAGVDYTTLASSVTIPAGSSSVTMTVKPKDDLIVEPAETVVATLASGSKYSIVADASSATVTIADNDVPPPVQSPFANPFLIGAGVTSIQAEDFDNGGEGLAYHDTESANLGGSYRANVGVDIEPTSDAGGGYNLGHVRAGEWLEYAIEVATAGKYDVSLRFASDHSGGTAHLEVDGAVLANAAFNLTRTDGWQGWQDFSQTGIALPAGQHILRLSFDSTSSGGDIGNVNYLTFTPTVINPWPSTWATGAAAPSEHYESASITVGEKIYVFGGFKDANWAVSTEYLSYDVATDTWTVLGNLPINLPETHQGITTDGARYVYLAGGLGGDLNDALDLPQAIYETVWRFDTQTNTWDQMTDLPDYRGAGVLQLLDGKLHYIGGFGADTVTDQADHWVYDLNQGLSGTWTNAAAPLLARDHASSVVLNGKIYVLGGETGHHHFYDQRTEVQVYDPATNAWTLLANMPIAKSHDEGATFVLNGQIVMAGGQVFDYAPTDNVIAYNPDTNTWTTLAPLPAPRQGLIVQSVNGKIIITLGGTDTNAPKKDTWIGTIVL